MKMHKKIKGAWLVHHTNKLQNITGPGAFEGIYQAGKCAILLSALSASSDQSLPMNRIRSLSKASNINLLELPTLLHILEKHKLISQSKHGVDVLGVTTPVLLEHAADIFESSEPSGIEEAALEFAERASDVPVEDVRIAEYLGDEFELRSSDTDDLLEQSEDVGFVDCEAIDGSKKLYFNGNLFRREEMGKISAVLNSLSSKDERRVVEFNELLTKKTCMTQNEAVSTLGKPLFQKLQSIGMYDENTVSNPQETMSYVTKPSAFNKFGNSLVEDALDLAKAFVSSLTYGMTRSTAGRGRITMIKTLMRRLINGYEVGPATAIGHDYKILELRGVIQVRQEGSMFHMTLLKKDVGQLALQAILQGDVSEQSLPQFPGAAVTQYKGPEVNRAELRRKRQVPSTNKQTRDLLLAIRTGRAF